MQVLKHEIVRPLRFVASEWGKNIGCRPWSTGKGLYQIFNNQKSAVLGPGIEKCRIAHPKAAPLDILYNILMALAAFSRFLIGGTGPIDQDFTWHAQWKRLPGTAIRRNSYFSDTLGCFF